eukprot:6797529-Pyramimonas_sp.AAC.1
MAFELVPTDVRREVCSGMQWVCDLPSRAYAVLFPWHGRNLESYPRTPLYGNASETPRTTKCSMVVTIPHDSVPFPFLALPQFPMISCPSRIMCEQGEKSEGERSGRR